MWQSVAAVLAAFVESSFPFERQRRLTLIAVFAIATIGIVLIALIGWVDLA